MKRRLKRWLNYILVRYIPSTSQIPDLESKRIAKYVSENYNVDAQLIILNNMKSNIIEFRKTQIFDKKQNIVSEQQDLIELQKNLHTLLEK